MSVIDFVFEKFKLWKKAITSAYLVIFFQLKSGISTVVIFITTLETEISGKKSIFHCSNLMNPRWAIYLHYM